MFLGVRYAEFDHKREFKTSVGGGSAPTTNVDWDGVGPRAGFDFAMRFAPTSNWSVHGGAAVAYLFGDYKTRYTANNGPSPINAKDSANIWDFEGQLALAYEIAPMVNLSVGYRAEYWSDTFGQWGNLQNPPGSVPGHGPDGDRWMHGPFVRVAYNIGTPRAPAPAPVAPAPAAVMTKNFIVLFDFDRSNRTAQAQSTIRKAAAASKTGGVQRVNVTGHADKSGTDAYNMAISLRRANVARDDLVRNGVPANAIVVVARGESRPLVPTADGVREPQNRRVEIMLS